MRFDKFTTRFQQAFADAQSLAVGNDNPYIEPQHLLFALISQREGGLPSLLARAGVNVGALRPALKSAMERLPKVEGTGGDGRYVEPVVTWRTSDASPSGAAIIGDTLYVAALRGERLWLVPVNGGEPRAELVGTYGRLRTIAVAPDGSLWITTSNTDGRGDARVGDDRILRFPLR